MSNVFFESWGGILRAVVISVLAYAALVILLRVSGKRTLSKMNAFDFVVTVALGSSLATSILTKNVPLSEGIVSFVMLIFLQFIVTWASVRSKSFSTMVKAQPVLLVYEGQYLKENMRKERFTKHEILAALRKQGVASIEEAKAVVLETDSSLTVIRNEKGVIATVLEGINR